MHIWSMDGQYNVMTIHVVLTDITDHEAQVQLKQKLRHELKHLNIDHATIEMEREGEECIFDKEQC